MQLQMSGVSGNPYDTLIDQNFQLPLHPNSHTKIFQSDVPLNNKIITIIQINNLLHLYSSFNNWKKYVNMNNKMVLSWFMWTTKVAIIADCFVLYTWNQVSLVCYLHTHMNHKRKQFIVQINASLTFFKWQTIKIT